MGNPLLFFIFIIVIDIVLKSLKGKKKIDKAKERRQRDLNKQASKPRPITDLRKILEEEIKKERERSRQREIPREKIETQPKAPTEINWDTGTSMPRTADPVYTKKEDRKVNIEERKEKNETTERQKINPREEIIKGIIFSEILSKPKSLQHKRRSL